MFLDIFNGLLKENFLNRKQFAEKCGIPYTTVIGWTNLNRMPDYYALIKIADFFDCSIDYLTGRSDEYAIADAAKEKLNDERELIIKYRRLNESDKNLVLKLVDRLVDD